MDTINALRGRMIPPKTAAEITSTSECTVHRWIAAGKVKAVKLSLKCTRIDGDSLADFLTAGATIPKTSTN